MACFVLELPHSLSILLKISATFQIHCNVFEIVFYKLFFVYWILRNNSPTLSFCHTDRGNYKRYYVILHFLNSLMKPRFTSVLKTKNLARVSMISLNDLN